MRRCCARRARYGSAADRLPIRSDDQQLSSAVISRSGETATSILEGVTVQGGTSSVSAPGGVLATSSNVVLEQCLLQGNTLGFLFVGGSTVLRNCVFRGNAGGAAQAMFGGSLEVDGCRFEQLCLPGQPGPTGAAAHIQLSLAGAPPAPQDVTFDFCTFAGNGPGEAVYSLSTGAMFRNSIVQGNASPYNGGSTTYTVTLSGGTLGTLVQQIPLGWEQYPNIPFLTGTVFTDVQAYDATAPFTLTWNNAGSLTHPSESCGRSNRPVR